MKQPFFSWPTSLDKVIGPVFDHFNVFQNCSTMAFGAEQEPHEERSEAPVPRVAERGDRIPYDDLLPFGDVDAGDALRRGDDVGDVNDARVGLAQRDLVQHRADIELLAGGNERHPRFTEGFERVGASGNARRREHDDEVVAREIGQRRDPLGVTGRDRDLQPIRGEDGGRAVDQPRTSDLP